MGEILEAPLRPQEKTLWVCFVPHFSLDPWMPPLSGRHTELPHPSPGTAPEMKTETQACVSGKGESQRPYVIQPELRFEVFQALPEGFVKSGSPALQKPGLHDADLAGTRHSS